MRANKPISIAMSVVLAVGLCPLPAFADDAGDLTAAAVATQDDGGATGDNGGATGADGDTPAAKDLPTAMSDLASKEKALDEAEANLEAAKTAREDADAALEVANNTKSARDEDLRHAQADKEAADAAKEAAQTAADEAAQAATSAQEASDAASEAKAQAEKNVADTTAAQQSAQAADEAAKADKAEADAALADATKARDDANAALQAAIDAGIPITNSHLFFEQVGATDAVLALDNAPQAGSTDLTKDTDATSIANMRKTFQFLRECNSIRAQQNLDELLVTDTLMAIAQSNLNWSDTNTAHSQQFNVGENLAWGSADNAYAFNWDQADRMSNPFEGWFDYERLLWLVAVSENPEIENMSAYELSQHDPETYGKVGHYLNIASPDYKYTGFAFSSDPDNAMSARAYGQTFSSSAVAANYNSDAFNSFTTTTSETAYTVDDYEKRFEDTVALPIFTDEQKAAYEAAKAAADAAQEAYDKAAADAEAKQAAADAAAEALAAAETAASEAAQALTDATAAADKAAEDLKNAQAADESAKAALAEATKTADEAATVVADAEKAVAEAAEGVEKAEADVASTQEALTAAEAARATAWDEFVAATVAARESFDALSAEEQEEAGEDTLATIEAAEDRAGIKRPFDVRSADITIEPQTYTGQAIEPAVSVVYDETTLQAGVDYTVEYADNVEVGTASATVTGIGAYHGVKLVKFDIAKGDISKMSASLSTSSYKYDGQAKTPVVAITSNGKTLVADRDYTVEYKDNTEVGTATVVATGAGNYEGTIELTFTIKSNVERLYGNNALDTMAAIVNAGSFPKNGTVVLATNGGFHDALTAAGVAGLANAPVLMTNGTSLSSQTRAQLEYLKPQTIVVCGGTAAVSDGALGEALIASGATKFERLWGQTATGTAANIFKEAESITGGEWSHMAFICTNSGYWDALAAAPVSYTLHMPIFLTEGVNDISEETLEAMGSDITNFYIVGGTAAVSDNVRQKLVDRGYTFNGRLGGRTAIETSEWVAGLGLSASAINANKVGIATVNDYYDALSGAAFCGLNKSVLLLVLDAQSHSIAGDVSQYEGKAVKPFVLADRADEISQAYIFGGPAAVSNETEAAIVSALH